MRFCMSSELVEFFATYTRDGAEDGAADEIMSDVARQATVYILHVRHGARLQMTPDQVRLP